VCLIFKSRIAKAKKSTGIVGGRIAKPRYVFLEFARYVCLYGIVDKVKE